MLASSPTAHVFEGENVRRGGETGLNPGTFPSCGIGANRCKPPSIQCAAVRRPYQTYGAVVALRLDAARVVILHAAAGPLLQVLGSLDQRHNLLVLADTWRKLGPQMDQVIL